MASGGIVPAVEIAPQFATVMRYLGLIAPAPPMPAAPGNNPVTEQSGKLLLVRGTPVPFVFASDVSSKTAEVGDKIPLTLAEDLRAGNVVVVQKGTPAVAIVTESDGTGMLGVPGALYFQVDSLAAGRVLIKLHGSAAKEGQAKQGKALGLMLVPLVPAGLFVHGKNAEIKQGALFVAFVDEDTLLPPSN